MQWVLFDDDERPGYRLTGAGARVSSAWSVGTIPDGANPQNGELAREITSNDDSTRLPDVQYRGALEKRRSQIPIPTRPVFTGFAAS